MYAWYEARCEDEPLHVVFRHLDHTLFKNVTKRLVEDVCISGAFQPIVIGEAKPLLMPGEGTEEQKKKVHEARKVGAYHSILRSWKSWNSTEAESCGGEPTTVLSRPAMVA